MPYPKNIITIKIITRKTNKLINMENNKKLTTNLKCENM